MSRRIDEFVGVLKIAGTWMSVAEYNRAYADCGGTIGKWRVDGAHVRAFARRNPGVILGGPEGWKHMKHATDSEVARNMDRLDKRAREIRFRADRFARYWFQTSTTSAMLILPERNPEHMRRLAQSIGYGWSTVADLAHLSGFDERVIRQTMSDWAECWVTGPFGVRLAIFATPEERGDHLSKLENTHLACTGHASALHRILWDKRKVAA